MSFYQSNHIRLHYVVRNAERGSPNSMVFQHGIGGDLRQPGRFLVSERTGIPVGALDILHADFRGHGQSEFGRAEDLSIATLGLDLAALLDHLELEDAIVGGISLGAVESPYLRCFVEIGPKAFVAAVLITEGAQLLVIQDHKATSGNLTPASRADFMEPQTYQG